MISYTYIALYFMQAIQHFTLYSYKVLMLLGLPANDFFLQRKYDMEMAQSQTAD